MKSHGYFDFLWKKPVEFTNKKEIIELINAKLEQEEEDNQ